jgi:peptidoglycan/LPS O-acetylase OafA/YrhL
MGTSGGKLRAVALDGLRGWSALAVVCIHLSVSLYGAKFPQIHSTPLTAWLLNPQMVLAIFLIISGFVLTINGWRSTDKTGTAVTMARRYTRLVIPILAATTLSFVVMSFGWNANVEAGQMVGDGWLTRYLNFPPNVVDMLVYTFFGVFVSQPQNPYQPFLWTMPYELWGSYFVLLVCYFERQVRRPYTILIAVILFFLALHPLAASLPVGALLALACRDGMFDRLRGRTFNIAATIAVPAALFVAGLLSLSGWTVASNMITIPLAALIVLCVFLGPALTTFMSNGVSQFLGRISYPIYLVHFAVLVVPLSHMLVAAQNAGILRFDIAIAISVFGVVLSIFAALVFQPVETFTAWVGRRIAAFVTGRRAPVPTAEPVAPVPAPIAR